MNKSEPKRYWIGNSLCSNKTVVVIKKRLNWGKNENES